MERDDKRQIGETDNSDFNSHAHVERDNTAYGTTLTANISTHTLTWSVTYQHLTLLSQFDISTHTLTWSVTVKDVSVCEPSGNFNSHAHVERDLEIIKIERYGIISTHTLTWSVTASAVKK